MAPAVGSWTGAASDYDAVLSLYVMCICSIQTPEGRLVRRCGAAAAAARSRMLQVTDDTTRSRCKTHQQSHVPWMQILLRHEPGKGASCKRYAMLHIAQCTLLVAKAGKSHAQQKDSIPPRSDSCIASWRARANASSCSLWFFSARN